MLSPLLSLSRRLYCSGFKGLGEDGIPPGLVRTGSEIFQGPLDGAPE